MAMLTLCLPAPKNDGQPQERTTPDRRLEQTGAGQTTSGVSYSSIIIQNEMSFGTLPVFLLLFYFISAVLFFLFVFCFVSVSCVFYIFHVPQPF